MRRAATALAVACFLAVVALYVAAFAASAGRKLYARVSHSGLEPVRTVSARTLDTIDAASVVLVGGARGVVALARGRRRRAVVTAAAVLLPIATTEILKPAGGRAAPGLRRWGERPESARTARRRERMGAAAGALLAAAFVVFVAATLATHREFADALRLRRSLVGTTGALAVASAVLVGTTALLAREPVRRAQVR